MILRLTVLNSDLHICWFIQLVNFSYVLKCFSQSRWQEMKPFIIFTISLMFLIRFTIGSLGWSGTRLDLWHIPWTRSLLVPAMTQELKVFPISLFLAILMYSLTVHAHTWKRIHCLDIVADVNWICKVYPQEAGYFLPPIARSLILQWRGQVKVVVRPAEDHRFPW